MISQLEGGDGPFSLLPCYCVPYNVADHSPLLTRLCVAASGGDGTKQLMSRGLGDGGRALLLEQLGREAGEVLAWVDFSVGRIKERRGQLGVDLRQSFWVWGFKIDDENYLVLQKLLIAIGMEVGSFYGGGAGPVVLPLMIDCLMDLGLCPRRIGPDHEKFMAGLIELGVGVVRKKPVIIDAGPKTDLIW